MSASQLSLLNQIISPLGILRESITFLALHETEDVITIGRTIKTTANYPEARANLISTINKLNSSDKIIITMGAAASYALTGLHKIMQIRGSLYFSKELNKYILPTLTPAMCNKEYTLTYLLQSDIRKWQDNNTEVKLTQYPVLQTAEDGMNFTHITETLQQLQSASLVSFDIEVVNYEVYCLAFAWEHLRQIKTLLVPFVYNSQNIWTEEQEYHIWLLIKQLLENQDVKKLGQNLIFDAQFLKETMGIEVSNNMEDTMIASGILYPEIKKSLAVLTSIYTNLPYYKDEGKIWLKLGGDDLTIWNYNIKDAATCIDIWKHQQIELDRYKLFGSYTFQKSLIPILCEMQRVGMYIDIEPLKAAAANLDVIINKLHAEIEELSGRKLNVNSSVELKKYFYEELGFKPLTNRVTGKVSVDKAALKKLAAKNLTAKKIMELKKVETFQNRYVKAKFDPDGRLRCSFNPVGTKSGRLSSSKTIRKTGINMQTIPNSFKCYVKADLGYIIYEVDLSQAENRVVALLGPELKMLEAFSTGVDIHSLTASYIYGKDISEVKKEKGTSSMGDRSRSERDDGKCANHSLNYGIGPRSFAAYYEMSEAQAKHIMNIYYSNYVGIKKFQNYVQAELRKTRSLTNPFGRRRFFLERWGDTLFKEAYSYIPQSTVADIINRGLRLLFSYRQDGVLVLNQVHDSLVFEIPKSLPLTKHVEILNSLRIILEHPIEWRGITMSIPADFKGGYDLYNMVKLNLNSKISVIKSLASLSDGKAAEVKVEDIPDEEEELHEATEQLD